jgi:hypothetical protein
MSIQRFLLTRGQLNAAISSLSRSLARSLAKPSKRLESIAQITQIVALVAGGAWVLWIYFTFNKSNNELINQQALLANKTAEITQDLNKVALQRSKESRLDVAMESSVVRVVHFDDGTFLHRYWVSLKAKNITDSTVLIPAIVGEFFIGTMPKDELKQNEALYINLPTQWQQEAVPGGITWTNRGRYARSQIDSPLDDKVKKDIEAFLPLAVDFGGSIRSGETTDIGLTFLIRSRPDAVAGAVMTYWDWDGTAGSSPNRHIYTNIELLLEAEDAPALKKDTLDSKDAGRGAKPK